MENSDSTSSNTSPNQFRLLTLFYAVSLLAISFANIYVLGIASLLVLVAWYCLFAWITMLGRNIVDPLFLIPCLVLLAGFLIPMEVAVAEGERWWTRPVFSLVSILPLPFLVRRWSAA